MGTQVSARSNGLNQAVIYGQLVTEPERRTLPSGEVAVSFSLTVRSPATKTTSVPLVWYSPPTRIDGWVLGDMIAAVGPVVRRFYHGGSGLGASTEVVVEKAERIGPRTKRAAVVANASDVLAAFVEAL